MMRWLGISAWCVFCYAWCAMSCFADDRVNARLDDKRVGSSLGDRLEMTKLIEKPADDLRVSRKIRRVAAKLDMRTKAKNTRALMRRKKTKRIVAGLM